MRQDIEFQAEGPRLRGWLYTPDTVSAQVPTVVMAHGFSAVKEMYLDRFAEAFAAAGLAALEAYARALEPKRLEILPGGHFGAYVGPGFEQASGAAAEWFVKHLVGSGRPARQLVTV